MTHVKKAAAMCKVLHDAEQEEFADAFSFFFTFFFSFTFFFFFITSATFYGPKGTNNLEINGSSKTAARMLNLHFLS